MIKRRSLPIAAIVVLVLLCIYLISMALPLLWGLMTTFKEYGDFRLEKILPTFPMTFANYIEAFKGFALTVQSGPWMKLNNGVVYFEGMLLNSFLYSLGGAFVQTAVTCITAYSTSRFNFKFNKVVYAIVVVTMILPIIGSLPSELKMADTFGLMDNMLGMYVLKANFLGMHYLIFHAMFKGIPKDFDEAAYIDGAGNIAIFFRIMLPLISGTFLTIMLLKFIDFWNDYMTPMVFLPSYPTISYGLLELTRAHKMAGGTPAELAACIMVFIPNFVIFVVFRNKLIGNISMGGLKE